VKKALIVGGGIGGLTAAIALQQVGFEVKIFERASEFREIGAGLWIWENAMTAMDSLKVGDAVRGRGVPNAHGGVRTWQGEPLIERIPSRRQHGSVAVLRADLQTALRESLDPHIIEFGAACADFTQDADGITVRLKDGQHIRGDVLIGADGIHSVIRSGLFGDAAQPRYAGFTAWRALTAFPHERIPSGVCWGNGSRFGFMPIRDGRVNWFAGRRIPAATPDASTGRKQELLEHFSRWFDPIPEMIRITDEAAIIRNDIYFGPLLKSWSRGRVTLLGDAAHPMTPSIGQGACQAIEDAVILARCLQANNDTITALQQYEQRRIPRANAVARYSRLIDWVAMWQHGPLCGLRNRGAKFAPASLRDRQLVRILDFSRA